MNKLFSFWVLTALVVPLCAASALNESHGCTDPIACNYDPSAWPDDGSCVYTDNPVVDMTSTTWTNYYNWGGFTGSVVVEYNANHTWTDGQGYNGFWSLCSDDLVHLYDNSINTEYVGMWNGSAFEGTMSNDAGNSGTFLLTPNNPIGDPCSDEDCPLEWSEELVDTNVQCASDLPTTCDDFYEYAGISGLEAVNSCTEETFPLATCFPMADQSLNLPITTCVATTAKTNQNLPEGEFGAFDGAVRIYGLEAMGLVDGDFFVEDPANPLTFRHAPDSRTARLTGTVYCADNPNQIFHVDARFENEDNAAEWLAEGGSNALLTAGGCDVDANAVSVFDLATMSRLEGDGELEGTLFIDHYPLTYSARFQLGQGVNNHNCNYGLGGWFRWAGTLNGEYVEGLSGDIVVDLECSQNEEACSANSEFLFEAVDDCGRILSTTVQVSKNDTEAPVITSGPADMTVDCQSVPPIAPAAAIVATDNCEAPLTISEGLELMIPGSCPHTYTLDRRWTVTDDCGNTAVHIQMIEVQDVTPPVLTAPEVVQIACEDWPVDSTFASATDNCGNVTITYSQADGDEGCIEPYTTYNRVYMAIDECGNYSTKAQTIVLYDNTNPVLHDIPEGYTAECTDELTLDMPTASDNCSDPTVTVAEVIVPGQCDAEYTLVRTFTATDACGNSSSASQTIEVVDSTAPTLTTVPYFEGFRGQFAAENWMTTEGISVTGNELTIVGYDNVDNPYDDGVLQTATAPCLPAGATVTFNWDYTLDDTEPSFDVGFYVNGELMVQLSDDNSYEGSGTVTFECSGGDVIGFGVDATDGCCGSATLVIDNFEVIGMDEPMDLPSDMMVECDEVDQIPAPMTLYAIGNCSVAEVSFSEAIEPGTCPQNYDIVRTWTGADECGNETIHQQTIAVRDTEAPEFTSVPVEVTIECSEALPTEMPTAIDNCGEVSLEEFQSIEEGDCPQEYTVTRMFVASDECGNSDTAYQVVNVVDTTAPVFDFVPSDYTVECSDEVTYEDAQASDNCGAVTLQHSVDTVGLTCPNNFEIIRTWVATDECGNSSTASQTITVEDTTAPVFDFVPADYTVECSDEVTYDDAEASDNCGEVTVAYSVDTVGLTCPNNFQIIRTWVATDECENSSTASQTITVEDTTAPVFDFVPADYTVECSDEVTYDEVEVSDNCGEVTVAYSVDTVGLTCPNNFEIIRTWVATDECENSSTASQTITVEDTTAPVFDFVPADYTIECTAEVVYDDAEASDNCGMVSISEALDTLAGDCAGHYTIVRTFTAMDDCDNASTATQHIQVVDTTAPEFISVPADYSIECTDEPTYGEVEVMDACSGWNVTMAVDTVHSECENVYDLVVVWTATDDCGNASMASQTISVIDTTVPQIEYSCGLVNGEVIEVCCEDLAGTIQVPAACELEATDFACGGELTIALEETYEGEYTPSETVDHWCVISDPQPVADGLTCDGWAPHTVHLFNFPGADFYSLMEGAVSHNVDGTMTYYLNVVAQDNPNAGWTMELQFSEPMDWFEWEAQPGNHSYKSDCGLGDHMTWDYSMMTSGVAEGWGEYEGSNMTLMHQPVSGYFGFQIGEGANNKNANYGFSGWFYCSGIFNGMPFNTSGDLFGELECCLPWTLDRAYTVSDCSGNVTTFHYEVHATGEACVNEDEGGVQDGEDQTMVTPKDLIEVLELMPNPTTGMTQVTLFTEEMGTTIQVSLLSMAGQEVMPLFQGQLDAGWPMPLMFDVSNLEAGMYQLRIHSKDFVTSKKLLVAH